MGRAGLRQKYLKRTATEFLSTPTLLFLEVSTFFFKKAPLETNTARFYFYEESKVVKLLEAERRMVVDRGWKKGETGSCSRDMVLVLKDENVLETCCPKMHIQLALLYFLYA